MITATDVLLYSLAVVCGVGLISYHWKRRKFYKYSLSSDGPFAWPFIGSWHLVCGNTEDLAAQIDKMMLTYKFPSRCWIGPYLIVPLYSPEDMQIVLSSPKCLGKGPFFEKIIPVQGEGIFSAPIDKWKRHRKMISPAFNQRVLNAMMPIFNDRSMIFIDKIKHMAGTGNVNFFRQMCLCTLDMICETSMGIKIDSQINESRHLHVMQRLMHISLLRMSNIWYYFDFLFYRLPISKEFEELRDEMHALVNGVIQQKRKEMGDDTIVFDDNKLKPFLELLLDISKKGEDFTDKELMDEIVSFIFGGSDTTATNNCFLSMLLAMNPDVQEKVYEEIYDIFGDSDRPVTCEDLPKLQLLDRAIKESLRLFPPALAFTRENSEDIALSENVTLPANTCIFMSVLHLHRNEKYWPNPYKFDPDRFLPEEVAKRHPFAFLPFSGGPRNCIGSKYGSMSMKVVMTNILRSYKLTGCKFKSVEEIKLDWKVVIYPVGGFSVAFEPRRPLH